MDGAAGLVDFIYQSVNHPAGFLGHGIGCWYYELPHIKPDTCGVLEPILVHPKVGGAKMGDSVLVTQRGARRVQSTSSTPDAPAF